MRSDTSMGRFIWGAVVLLCVFGAVAAWAISTNDINLGVAGGTAADDTVTITRDGSDNLTFIDPNAGTKTLTQLGATSSWEVSGSDLILSTNRNVDMQSTATIINVPTPSAAGRVANKAYVDAQVVTAAGDSIQDGDANTTVTVATGNDIDFYNAGSGTAVIAADGRAMFGSTNTGLTEGVLTVYANSASVSDAGLTIKQAGAGDSQLEFMLTVASFMMGIDNSDSDKFKINSAVDFTTGVPEFTIIAGTGIGILDTSPAVALDVGGAGNFDDGLVVNLSKGASADLVAHGDTTDNILFADSSTNRVGILTATPSSDFEVLNTLFVNTATQRVGIGSAGPTNLLELQEKDGNPSVFKMQAHHDFNLAEAEPEALLFNMQASRGTSASEAVLQSGDIIHSAGYRGYDSDSYTFAAVARVLVDGTPGDDDMPGRFEFHTTADGASTSTEVLRLDSSQNVKIPSGSLAFSDLAAHETLTSGQAKLWALGGELLAIDDSGNTTTLSSHIGDSWTYKSGNAVTGKYIEIDMERAMVALDAWYRREVDPSEPPFVRVQYRDRATADARIEELEARLAEIEKIWTDGPILPDDPGPYYP